MGLLAYGFLALAIIGSLGGIAYKLDSNGYERGSAAVRQEWQEASAKAVAEADAARKAQEASREAQDKLLAGRLAYVQKHARSLQDRLAEATKAAGPAAQCAIPPSLLDVWNAANAGEAGKGQPAAGVPDASRKPAPAR